MESIQSLQRRLGTPGTIIGTAILALIVNLIILGIGNLAGGSFDGTTDGEAYHVGVPALALFTLGPLLVGLTLTAIISRWWRWASTVALVIGPLAAIGTIFTMTVPADLDTTSKITLAAAHVVVAIAVVVGILAIRTPATKSAFRFA